MVAKFLRVDALLEFSCHEMTLWNKLGGSILIHFCSTWMQNHREIIKVHYLRNQFLILDSRRNGIFFLLRDILLYNQKPKVVSMASAQEHCRSFQAYLSYDRLRWPVTIPCFAVLKACRRVSTNQTLYTNVLMNQSEIEVNMHVCCGCEAREKACCSVRAVWATVLHLTPFPSSHPVAYNTEAIVKVISY